MAMVTDSAVIDAFSRCWDTEGMNKAWQKGLLPYIQQEIESCLLKQERFQVLSVGSGYGESDLGLMHFLHNKYPALKMHFTVVEPDESSMSGFKKKIDELRDGTVGGCIEMSWNLCGLEDYLQQEGGASWHLVHMFYCIQMFTDYLKSLQQLYSRLKSSGVMAIVGFSKVSFAYGCVFQEFSQPGKFLHGQEHMEQLFNEDVLNRLRETGWSYDSQVVKYLLDVSHCFDPESLIGDLMLGSFLNTDSPRSTISKENIEQVLSFLKTMMSWREFPGLGRRECVDDTAHFIFISKIKHNI